ncbi:hypothetical protein TraAM80_01409 [Trypanosoma rangeli]|uniref:Uncharacterized protein n=1 Tax=Trypanosoma rangeli TaxID=5698 RepID=A0A3R7NRZ1_TRYRA|nr:uncharacterized protein TraAM80_01409 [Trypanosoma rangeli]RNF10705.1 hypothetical protein TraAM80_01409 [Trypanosoma rangeli]|eukprot:RNF10705.1 hypothetical protein TraAM80_01409 [Trypanosoma rangeli]
MRIGNGSLSGSCNLSETQEECSMALKQSIQKGRFVAYYTHPRSLPHSHSAVVETCEKLPRDEATITPGDFSFLPYPSYCGLTTVDKVLYKHCLSLDISS